MTVPYALLERQVCALLSGESDFVANAGNFAAFVQREIPDINWAGFYLLLPTGELLLGPFSGPPACTRLAAGRGVCGIAVACGQTMVVDDVTAFVDHIVCDIASRAEIVVPLYQGAKLIGVFDVDSPTLARFSTADHAGIEALVASFAASLVTAAATETPPATSSPPTE